MAVQPLYAAAWVDGTGTVTWANPPSVRGLVWSTDDLMVPVAAFAQTPRAGDRIDLFSLEWAAPGAAAAQNILASYDGLDVADGHGLLIGHTVDPANLSFQIDHAAKTLWVTYTVNTVPYYTDERGNVVRQADRQNWWGMRGLLVTVPASVYHRTDWTNGLVAAIDASPEFPVEVLGREASHFTKAQIDFHTTRDTLAFDEDLPNQTPKQQAAVRRLRDGTMRTCRQVELESRRTAFARAVEVCLDRARTITDTYSVEDDATALGQYVEHALTTIGDGEATETTHATLRTRLEADLASRDPVTYTAAHGAEVGALVNGAPYARLVTQVHLLLTGLTPVLDPIDLYAPEAKRVPVAQVPDTGAKLAVQGTIPDTGSPPAVAIRLTRHGGTRALQRRFDDETTWSAWADPTDADLRAAGRNQTVWFRYAPKMSNDDV